MMRTAWACCVGLGVLAAANPVPGIADDDVLYTRADLEYDFTGRPVTTADRLDLSLNWPGRTRLDFALVRSEYWRDTGTRSVFTEPGSAELSLPGDWVAGPTTAAMTGTGDTLAFQPRILRELLAAGWTQRADDHLHFDVNLHHERRRGIDLKGGTFGSTGGNARAAVLPAPVDHETTEWTLSVTHALPSHRFRAGLRLSTFDNAHDALRWQNPFSGVGGWGPGSGFPDGHGELAREPDNRAWDTSLGWAWSGPGGIHLNLDGILGRHTQDAPFLAYTGNPQLEVNRPLPRSSLQGRLDWHRVAARARWSGTRRVSLDLDLVHENHDDRTPPALFVYVPGDAVHQPDDEAAAQARWRLPRDFRRTEAAGAVHWRLAPRQRIGLHLKRERAERAWSEVAETVTDTHAVEWRRSGPFAAHLRAERSRRDGSGYRDNHPYLLKHTEAYLAGIDPDLRFENHPLLRRFNLADRERDALRGGVTITRERWSLGLQAHVRDDEYRGAVFGLTDSRQRGVHADLGIHAGDAGDFTLWASRDRWDSRQDGRHFRGFALEQDIGDPARDWHASSRDRARAAGFSWSRENALAGADVDFDYSHTRTRVDVEVTGGEDIATAPLPTVRADIHRVSLGVSRGLTDRWRSRIGFEYERWSSRDWATDGVAVDTMANVLGTGERAPDHARGWISLGLTYRF